MISFEKFVLPNGLRVIVNQDTSTPLAAVNMLYNVGSRDEDPEHTGFAHLFEHLMFGGSRNIPEFDTPLQAVGGDSNAFTNANITNYYISIPVKNIETAFWLESDRMLGLKFDKKNLDTQKAVVAEEFKQRFLNQPYGDEWLLMSPLAYKIHPYQWTSIGKDISHIEKATLSKVNDFFYSYYAPNNAILSVSGNISVQEVESLAKKWFGGIPSRSIPERKIMQEPAQKKYNLLEVTRDVPYSAISMAWHMQNRLHEDYYASDLISDLLANGKSSRLYLNLVKGKELFGEINAYITGDTDPGLLVITGKVKQGININDAENAIWLELKKLSKEISEPELEKVKNKAEAMHVISEMNILNKAMNLASFECLGDVNWANKEIEKYRTVTLEQVTRVAREIFRKENCSVLFYHPMNK